MILVFCTNLHAQLSFKNHLEWTDWHDYDRRIWENWTDVAYQWHGAQLGGRYEINYPPDPFIYPQDSLLKQFDLTFLYAEYDTKNWNLRAGNFYSMFGRGLVLRTYEDRNLRVDNNILGGKVEYHDDIFYVKALAGQMRDRYNRRGDTVYGGDIEVNPVSFLQLGANYLYQTNPEGYSSSIGAARMNWLWSWGDLYAEFARPEGTNRYSSYMGFTGAAGDFTFTVEYKNYNHLAFKNKYGTEYSAPPALTREHTFSLLNRHPHALNLDDEQGYQLEVTWFSTTTWDVIANHSKTLSHKKQRLFEEYYLESHNVFFDNKLETRLAGAWTFDFTTNTENITSIIDPQVVLSKRDLIHLSWQHQHTKNLLDLSEYDTELLLIEYSRSPYGSLALVGEYTNQFKLNNIKMERHTWLYGQLTLNFFNNQELHILYGSRQAGFVCVGGICRYEPEFRGVEIRLVNRF
ncbi:hypothetical protein EH223_04150 [candidate division KSB1 bacterium]|nr:hypothetical protein [candidate division KSB1 bacterium]RQW05675.1 MAG: hypothetical protein EH223_04150 [candidate division KSB1 bacterium]